MVEVKSRRPHGRRVQASGGFWAWVPAPLPPDLVWSRELAAALSSADQAIGRLAGEGRRLPNPHLLIGPFLRREAVLSSRIEGTETTFSELLAAEAGVAVEAGSADLKEVANYVTALEYGESRLSELPLSLRLVKELHGKLMRGVRGEVATPGEFRRSQNWIGPPGSTLATATYVPPPVDELMGCLGDWETFLHDTSLPVLIQAGIVHSQFEAIHPFLDGNGRVGRLLITLLLLERKILPSPLLYLSAYFESTRQEYYARLLAVTRGGEWEEWLIYFLVGVASQANDALQRIERIDHLLAEWRHRLAASPSRWPERIAELLVENPFLSIRGAAERLEVAFTTAQRAIERLEAEKILVQANAARRNRLYVAPDLLRILE